MLATTQVPTTKAAPTTEAPLTSPKISLQFSLTRIFTSSLSNSSSPEFQDLESQVVTQLNNVYKAKFGASFIRTVVNSFRSGSIVVDSTLIFNNISSVPNNSLAAQTLQNAITFNTSGLTLPVNSSSIVVTPFKALAGRVVSEVNRIYASTPNFLRSIVNSFTSGSVVTKMTLVFRNQTSVPNASSALATFSNSSTSLSIVPGSVTVESSVNSGSAPGPTTFCLAALPLTLALLMIQLLSS
ncbi:unnamed protein product [Coregonus sp. 'balchen']|nr:unnamed protein product [Coregonus sp. 'balchen']